MSNQNIIVTKSGKRIPQLDVKPHLILDRVSVLYGKSNSGKSVFIKYLLKTVKDYIPVAFVISPTEPANRAYEKFIDKSLIHYDLNVTKGEDGFLEKFWHWATIRSSIYRKVNRKDILLSLYSRLRTPEIDKMVDRIEQKRKNMLEGVSTAKHDDVNQHVDELLVKLIKKHIQRHRHVLERQQHGLNEDELYSLAYIDLNPRVILIFDDCASDLKSYFNKPIFRKIFYQSRHSFITSIFAVQDDTDLPANLRKNVALSLFMTPAVAKSNFERGSNKFSKEIQQAANSIYDEVFTGFRKLAFMDGDVNKQYFYHVTAELVEPFRFGSYSLRSICTAVEGEEGSVDKANPFYDKFKLITKSKKI